MMNTPEALLGAPWSPAAETLPAACLMGRSHSVHSFVRAPGVYGGREPGSTLPARTTLRGRAAPGAQPLWWCLLPTLTAHTTVAGLCPEDREAGAGSPLCQGDFLFSGPPFLHATHAGALPSRRLVPSPRRIQASRRGSAAEVGVSLNYSRCQLSSLFVSCTIIS